MDNLTNSIQLAKISFPNGRGKINAHGLRLFCIYQDSLIKNGFASDQVDINIEDYSKLVGLNRLTHRQIEAFASDLLDNQITFIDLNNREVVTVLFQSVSIAPNWDYITLQASTNIFLLLKSSRTQYLFNYPAKCIGKLSFHQTRLYSLLKSSNENSFTTSIPELFSFLGLLPERFRNRRNNFIQALKRDLMVINESTDLNITLTRAKTGIGGKWELISFGITDKGQDGKLFNSSEKQYSNEEIIDAYREEITSKISNEGILQLDELCRTFFPGIEFSQRVKKVTKSVEIILSRAKEIKNFDPYILKSCKNAWENEVIIPDEIMDIAEHCKHIHARAYTRDDISMMEKWKKFGFNSDFVDLAIKHSSYGSGPDIFKVDKFLAKWHEYSVKSLAEAEKVEEEERKKRAATYRKNPSTWCTGKEAGIIANDEATPPSRISPEDDIDDIPDDILNMFGEQNDE